MDQHRSLGLLGAAWCVGFVTALSAQPRWTRVDRLDPRDPVPGVFDAARAKLVVFGASFNRNFVPQTLEWDGAFWRDVRPNTSPPGRVGHSLVYDATARRSVLFGGDAGTLLADLWEWDGVNWLNRTFPGPAPTARARHAAAYDSVRQRLVLFGGNVGGSPSNDTWEWDGTVWHLAAPTITPPARTDHCMAYDPVRQRTVLFGGAGATTLADTWEWDGGNWQQIIAPSAPSPSVSVSATWDPGRRRVVVASGGGSTVQLYDWDGVSWTLRAPTPAPRGRELPVFAADTVRGTLLLGFGSAGGSRLTDLWELAGNGWVERLVAHPTQRFGAGVAYDEVRGEVVLHGGASPDLSILSDTWVYDGAAWSRRAASGPRKYSHALTFDANRGVVLAFGDSDDQLWQWDGSTWSQLPAAVRPAARNYPAMTYDRRRGRAVLFGGESVGLLRNDMWEWDGTRWFLRTPSPAPMPRYGATMCYDEARGVSVLYGGRDATSSFRDTWLWDGVSWRLVSTAQPTSTGLGHAMVYDRERGRCVMIPSLGDVHWEFDGSSWQQRVVSPRPSARSGTNMVYDPRRGRAVLFGGQEISTPSVDTWELSYPSDVVGAGQTVSRLAFQCSAPPVLGANCCLTFPTVSGSGYVLLSPGAPVLPPVELNLPLFCAPARIYVDLGRAIGLFSAGSPSTVCVPLPADPNLLYQPLAAQGFALDPAPCVRVGDGVSLRVQAR